MSSKWESRDSEPDKSISRVFVLFTFEQYLSRGSKILLIKYFMNILAVLGVFSSPACSRKSENTDDHQFYIEWYTVTFNLLSSSDLFVIFCCPFCLIVILTL